MMIRKEALVTIMLLLYIQMVMGFMIHPVSIVNWAEGIWNLITTGSMRKTSSGVWGQCSKSSEYTQALSKRTGTTLVAEEKAMETHQDEMNQRLINMEVAINRLRAEFRLDLSTEHFSAARNEIQRIYSEFQTHLRHPDFQPNYLCTEAKNLLQHDQIKQPLAKMRDLLVEKRSTFLDELVKNLHDESHGERLCGQGHSPYDYLYSIYHLAVISEKKAYILEAYSRHLLHNNTHPNCQYDSTAQLTYRMNLLQQTLRGQMIRYTQVFMEKMQNISRQFRACDANHFARDETYFELEGAIQYMLTLPRNYNTGIFRREGNELADLYDSGDLWDKNTGFRVVPVGRPCLRDLHSCHIFAPSVKACIAESGPKRYDWISRTPAEESRKCQSNKYHNLQAAAGENVYMCMCIDTTVDSLSTHIFNLQVVEADVNKHMVVTGIRFTVYHRVMQFQIQQGKLEKNGTISGAHWKPVQDISEKIRAHRLGRRLRGEAAGVEENVDYSIIPSDGVSYIKFDTLKVPPGHVLTGVKFHSYLVREISYIGIAVISREFNIFTGLLDLNAQPNIQAPPIPTNHDGMALASSNQLSNPASPAPPRREIKFVLIIASMNADNPEVTLPYFDAVPLLSHPVAPLGGVGMFYKSNENSTGFVSLEFVSINHVYYLNESLNNAKSVATELNYLDNLNEW